MHSLKFRHGRHGRYGHFLALVALFWLASTLLVAAQSGRKQKKAEPQPPVQGINQPEARTEVVPEVDPNEKPEADKDQDPKLAKHAHLMSAMPDMNVSLFFADIARQGCSQELKRLVRTLNLSDSSNKTRSDAIRMAKDDDQLYVILLEITTTMGGGMIDGADLQYTVFEPKTAKVVATGSGFPRAPNVGGGSIPIGGNSTQIKMDWAARDVADQIVNRLKWRAGR